MSFLLIAFIICWISAFFISNIFDGNMRALILSSLIVGMVGVLYFNVEISGDW